MAAHWPHQDDLIGRPDESSHRLGRRWKSLAPRRRVAVAAGAVVLVGLPLAVLAGGRAHGWLVERQLRDEVALTATAGYWSSSTSPTGGRINFFVVVGNTGPRPVRIDSVESDPHRLTVRSLPNLRYQVLPGQAINVPVSLRLDCTVVEAAPLSADAPASIAAHPLSGRRHRVVTGLGHPALFTDLADNLCRADSGLQNQDMAAPVR